jgi:hypothetical protein
MAGSVAGQLIPSIKCLEARRSLSSDPLLTLTGPPTQHLRTSLLQQPAGSGRNACWAPVLNYSIMLRAARAQGPQTQYKCAHRGTHSFSRPCRQHRRLGCKVLASSSPEERPAEPRPQPVQKPRTNQLQVLTPGSSPAHAIPECCDITWCCNRGSSRMPQAATDIRPLVCLAAGSAQ